jgi:hypothetical protein
MHLKLGTIILQGPVTKLLVWINDLYLTIISALLSAKHNIGGNKYNCDLLEIK